MRPVGRTRHGDSRIIDYTLKSTHVCGNPSMTTSRPFRLLTPVELASDRLPAALEGLRIVHLTDLHVRRPRRRHARLCAELAAAEYDLLIMTGDYMHHAGHEQAALTVVRGILDAARPRLGTVASFGNHDDKGLREPFVDLPLRCLRNSAWAMPQLPLTLLGLDYTPRARRGDLVAAMLDEPDDDGDRFRLLLAHEPMWLVAAADAGIDVMFAGHTHGGQLRLPGRTVIYNHVHWPLSFTSGVMQLGRTISVVSNGLGEGWFDHMRSFCPPHAPLVTLRRSARPIAPSDNLRMLRAW